MKLGATQCPKCFFSVSNIILIVEKKISDRSGSDDLIAHT